MSQKVVIRYKTRKDYCHCCGHKLDSPKISGIKEFEFNKENAVYWGGEEWKFAAEDQDYLQQLIQEFVYETISFYATSSYEKLLIENSEFENVKKLILSEVITNK